MLQSYNFGDCEIRSITFNDENVVMNIFDPKIFNYISITFENVLYIEFNSDHMQNVISDITLVTESEYKNHYVSRNLQDKHDHLKYLSKDFKYAKILPISGLEAFLVCKDIYRNE